MIEIEIDGKKVEVQEGSMVMHAAHKLDIYVPHFCYHKKLSIAANCRMCLVEVEKAPKPLPACATPVTQGMIVRTHSEKAVQAQKAVMEFLLINHPLDCPICDQGGECQLQDLAVGYGGSNSRYQEEKRVVFHKNLGPLVSAEEMSRCIHCTRCVRFGQEIAGVMELGMAGRGEHSEIMSFLGRNVESEVSGNMIDICPVGALTSKPFRYTARTWELARRKSVSPHDGLGSNLVVQVKQNKVMRVLPLENESINECWISDRDRFSYEGLNSAERLTQPMIKQNGQWQTVDWSAALEYVRHGLTHIQNEHGAASIAALAAGYSTTEELYLLQKLMRGLGSENIDYRARQADFSTDAAASEANAANKVSWLGMPVAEINKLDRIFLIGSFLRNDHPLLAVRVRDAVKRGAKVSVLHAVQDDLLMPIAHRLIVAPSAWEHALAQVVVAVAAQKGIAAPTALQHLSATQIDGVATEIAQSLLAGQSKAIFLGHAALQHQQASNLRSLAHWLARETGARLGILDDQPNSVGAQLVHALPGQSANQSGLNAHSMFAQPRKAYVLLHSEPQLDSAHAPQAMHALNQADMVVQLSPYKVGLDYADVILPIAPFTETSGTYVNMEGVAQSFQGVVRPLGETRPAWKVLRVLGNLLKLKGFDYETSEQVRDAALPSHILAQLDNQQASEIRTPQPSLNGLERVTDVPLYFTDAMVRHAESLQKTRAAQTPQAIMSAATLQQLNITAGQKVNIQQGQGSVQLVAAMDDQLPTNVVRIAAGHLSTAQLPAYMGAVNVQTVGGV